MPKTHVHAGHGSREIGEVFGAHRRSKPVHAHVAFITHVARKCFRQRNIVDHRRIAANDAHVRGRTVRRGNVVDDPPDASLRVPSRTSGSCARSVPLHLHFIGDYVVSIAAADRSDRYDDAFQGIRFARGDSSVARARSRLQPGSHRPPCADTPRDRLFREP